jgi:glutamine synthetase type III
MSLEPLGPLQAEDALVYCEEAIKNIVRQHGLRATLYPKPFEKLTGIGLHHHLSISRKDKEEAFLAGSRIGSHWQPFLWRTTTVRTGFGMGNGLLGVNATRAPPSGG